MGSEKLKLKKGKRKIVLGQGRVFPMTMRLLLTGLTIGLIFVMFDKEDDLGVFVPIGFFILSGIVPIYWTARRILEINFEESAMKTYVWAMGFKLNQKNRQNMHFEKLDFRKVQDGVQVYLITSNEESVFLLSQESVEEATKKVEGLGLIPSSGIEKKAD